MRTTPWSFIAALSALALPAGAGGTSQAPGPLAAEPHLANIRQLTFGGENAEAYFSSDGRRLVFQSTRDGAACDQIYTMAQDGSNVTRVSTGTGRTTCGFFDPGGDTLVFSSTHLAGAACPPRPDFAQGYVWPIHDAYDVFRVDADGTNLRRITETPGYDAEATIGRDGRIVFTSVRGALSPAASGGRRRSRSS